MYRLRLVGRLCLSCGICQDLCAPAAIGMQAHRGRKIEGETLTYRVVGRGERELEPRAMGTFPYLAEPVDCDGCQQCVRECPVGALELTDGNAAPSTAEAGARQILEHAERVASATEG